MTGPENMLCRQTNYPPINPVNPPHLGAVHIYQFSLSNHLISILSLPHPILSNQNAPFIHNVLTRNDMNYKLNICATQFSATNFKPFLVITPSPIAVNKSLNALSLQSNVVLNPYLNVLIDNFFSRVAM